MKLAVPLLRVADVERSLNWYRDTLGFRGDLFPAAPPYLFAILRQGDAEIMIKCGTPGASPAPRNYDWDVYLRVEDPDFRALFAKLKVVGVVTRRLERMFYGLAEFEIKDPDGYVLCLSQQLDDADDLPSPAV